MALKNNNFEFSREIDLNTLGAKKSINEHIEANEEECDALIERLHVDTVKSFEADFKAKKIPGGNYFLVEGVVKAGLVQKSIISMKEVGNTVEVELETMFTLDNEVFNVDDSSEYEVDEDPYTPIYKGKLNIGELAVQYLSLEIDRYPKLDDEDFGGDVEVNEIAEEKPKKNNPFSVLAQLKDKKD